MIPILNDKDMVLVYINKNNDNFKVLLPNESVNDFANFVYSNKDKDIRDIIEEGLTIYEGHLAFSVNININEEENHE